MSMMLDIWSVACRKSTWHCDTKGSQSGQLPVLNACRWGSFGSVSELGGAVAPDERDLPF